MLLYVRAHYLDKLLYEDKVKGYLAGPVLPFLPSFILNPINLCCVLLVGM